LLKFHSTIFLLLTFNLAGGQISRASLADRYFSLGAYSKNFIDIFSFTSNPAAIVLLKEFTVGVAMERRFLLNELNQYTIAVGSPSNLGGLGLQINYFGYNGYNEFSPGIAYGKHLGPVEVGIKFNYSAIRIPGYGSAGSFIAELGTICHLTEKIHSGLHLRIPLQSRSDRKEKFGYAYEMGFGYELSSLVFLGTAFFKEEDKPVDLNVGLHYQFAKQFFARMGILTQNPEPYLAAGWKWRSLRIDLTAAYHPELGLSPGLLLIYQPTKD